VVAEGVETPQQSSFLQQAGCDFSQGYLLSKPVPTDQFEAIFLKAPANMAAATRSSK
jgi:EAL domain-containing protein (putative c-di-GMP-specific phosphodiesterase class I)